MRAILTLGAALAVTLQSASCRPPRNASADAQAETLIGIVSITGTSFEKRIVLRAGDTSTYLSATGDDSDALTRLGGVEVEVSGKRSGDSFVVERFAALRVAGAAVVDGVLRRDGDRVLLETSKESIPLGNPPSAFRGMIGARVWVGGPLDRGPNVYGLIRPAQ